MTSSMVGSPIYDGRLGISTKSLHMRAKLFGILPKQFFFDVGWQNRGNRDGSENSRHEHTFVVLNLHVI